MFATSYIQQQSTDKQRYGSAILENERGKTLSPSKGYKVVVFFFQEEANKKHSQWTNESITRRAKAEVKVELSWIVFDNSMAEQAMGKVLS